MSEIILVIQYARKFESILEKSFGASGRGLTEKVNSTSNILPKELIDKIKVISSIRNQVLHKEDGKINNLEKFIALCIEIQDSLNQICQNINSKDDSIIRQRIKVKGELLEQRETELEEIKSKYEKDINEYRKLESLFGIELNDKNLLIKNLEKELAAYKAKKPSKEQYVSKKVSTKANNNKAMEELTSSIDTSKINRSELIGSKNTGKTLFVCKRCNGVGCWSCDYKGKIYAHSKDICPYCNGNLLNNGFICTYCLGTGYYNFIALQSKNA